MRCKNCGWPNKPNETTCAKCNAPLDAEEEHSKPLHATVSEQEAFGNVNVEENVCPKCGYPIRDHVRQCPNCNYDLIPILNNADNTHYRSTRMENPIREKNVKGTINPYMESAAPEPGFILTPVKRINEKKDLCDLEYVGSEVALTRENTEPENGSITSQIQALLTFSNGNWNIEDKSEQGTTFIKASKKIELNDGDIILLGNRLFKFRKSEN